MHSEASIGFTDGQSAALADASALLRRGLDAAAHARAMITRALAAGGRIAEEVGDRSDSRVRSHDMALRSIAAEFAGILMMDDRTVQRRIGDARELQELYPRTFEAGAARLITERHERLITELGAPLPLAVRSEFEGVAIEICRRDTPGRVRSQLEILAARLHPRTFADRHRDARASRGVRVVELGEGMCDVVATLPSVLGHAVHDRLTAQARTIGGMRRAAQDSDGPADDRTIDQLRADVFADTLLTAAPQADPTRLDDGPGTLGAIRARVQVVVPALSALGADDGPVDLVGHSPIDAETARALLGSTVHPIERILTDPVTGSVVEVDTYERPASLDRYLRARDQRCRFPGCRLPAVRCEVDHTEDHARGGRTRRGNLGHLCQRHHSMKQFTPWRVRQLAGGVLEWTSPLGVVYIDEPPRPVTFLPDTPPDPRAAQLAAALATTGDSDAPF